MAVRIAAGADVRAIGLNNAAAGASRAAVVDLTSAGSPRSERRNERRIEVRCGAVSCAVVCACVCASHSRGGHLPVTLPAARRANAVRAGAGPHQRRRRRRRHRNPSARPQQQPPPPPPRGQPVEVALPEREPRCGRIARGRRASRLATRAPRTARRIYGRGRRLAGRHSARARARKPRGEAVWFGLSAAAVGRGPLFRFCSDDAVRAQRAQLAAERLILVRIACSLNGRAAVCAGPPLTPCRCAARARPRVGAPFAHRGPRLGPQRLRTRASAL
jgi:hypothetical protein